MNSDNSADMSHMTAYLDNAASTRPFKEVTEEMSRVMLADYANPASLHSLGLAAERLLRGARESIAGNIKASEGEIVFTSGGTESNNLAIIGGAMANRRSGTHIITTVIEHPAVAECFTYLENEGFTVTRLPVDRDGIISIDDLADSITDDTILVSIMHTNNEIGAAQPINEAGALIKRLNPRVLFHTDAVQGMGKADIFPRNASVDLLSASAHKFHGPKGAGFLYVKAKTKLTPLMLGGGQQDGRRSGTENVAAIIGMARALELMKTRWNAEAMAALRERFIEGLNKITGATINGSTSHAVAPRISSSPAYSSAMGRSTSRMVAPHIISATFSGIRSEVLLHALEERGIYVSTGSACSSKKSNYRSPTLKAIGLGDEAIGMTLRFSLSLFTTEEEIDYTLRALSEVLPILRKYKRK